jgi:hypothetical protein
MFVLKFWYQSPLLCTKEIYLYMMFLTASSVHQSWINQLYALDSRGTKCSWNYYIRRMTRDVWNSGLVLVLRVSIFYYFELSDCVSLRSEFRYDFNMETMSGSSLPPVICRRAHVLFMLFVFACSSWWPTHIVWCFCFVSLRRVYPMLPVSLDCPL